MQLPAVYRRSRCREGNGWLSEAPAMLWQWLSWDAIRSLLHVVGERWGEGREPAVSRRRATPAQPPKLINNIGGARAAGDGLPD